MMHSRIGQVKRGVPISDFGLNVKAIQRERGIKHAALAADVGVSINTLTSGFRPNSGMRLNIVYRIAKVLDVDVWTLFMPAVAPSALRGRPPGPSKRWADEWTQMSQELATQGLSSAQAARAMSAHFDRLFTREMLLSHSARHGYRFKGVKGKRKLL